jgi:diguanylate cyclase (GGDEF)-like protein
MSRVHPDDEAMFRRAVSSAIQRGSALGLDCRIVPGQGPVRFVHVQAEILHDPEGNPVSFSGTIQDISERKRAEEQIRLLAYFDGLTGLPNRVSFHDRLRKVLSTAERKGQLAAVMFLDLDNFKRINDSLGHSAGDLLLQGVAERLGALVRFSDTLSRDRDPGGEGVLSRLGGDEFTILLPGLTRPEDAAKVARRILESLRPPFPLGGSEVSATASIGIGIFPQDGANPEELLRNADAALYHAKDLGRNNFQFYAPSLNEMAALRLEMESALRVAVGREEFVVHFQPQLNAYRGQLIGIEALIRWQHPERGLLAPDLFIPLAEETGLIKSMDEWVLGAACREAARWRQAGLPSVRIAVNLSGHQFRRSDLVERLADIVAHAGLLPTDVELEITETVLMEDAQQAVLVLKELKAIGFRIAVDDFGIGYSSLNYLRKFPLDVLKIDRSFLADVPANKENEKIVAAILSLAQSLDIETIAEGVESPAQRDFLLANGCDHMQGYLFGRAMVPAEMEALLRTLAGRAAPEVATSKG